DAGQSKPTANRRALYGGDDRDVAPEQPPRLPVDCLRGLAYATGGRTGGEVGTGAEVLPGRTQDDGTAGRVPRRAVDAAGQPAEQLLVEVVGLWPVQLERDDVTGTGHDDVGRHLTPPGRRSRR